MKKSIVSNLLVGFSILLLLGGTAWADPYRLTVDVAPFAGMDFEVEIDLFDNSGVVGDSWALIDNLQIKDVSSAIIEMVDFEDGTLQGFDESWNPDSVDIVSGDWWSGNYMMRIDEDPMFTPTITYRDFLASAASTLSIDFKLISDGTVGPWGQDALVVSLLDPVTLNPLIFGLTGTGDFLEATASGNLVSPEVTGLSIVPAPGALLLGMIGIGTVGIFRRFRKSV